MDFDFRIITFQTFCTYGIVNYLPAWLNSSSKNSLESLDSGRSNWKKKEMCLKSFYWFLTANQRNAVLEIVFRRNPVLLSNSSSHWEIIDKSPNLFIITNAYYHSSLSSSLVRATLPNNAQYFPESPTNLYMGSLTQGWFENSRIIN